MLDYYIIPTSITCKSNSVYLSVISSRLDSETDLFSGGIQEVIYYSAWFLIPKKIEKLKESIKKILRIKNQSLLFGHYGLISIAIMTKLIVKFYNL